MIRLYPGKPPIQLVLQLELAQQPYRDAVGLLAFLSIVCRFFKEKGTLVWELDRNPANLISRVFKREDGVRLPLPKEVGSPFDD
jgi:hypothetical protein